MALQILGDYLNTFFQEEKKALLAQYPGLNLHRLRQDIKLHAFLNGIDSEELFEFPYLPHRRHPFTIFFSKLREGIPLEYITGYSYFFRSHFRVTQDVLIPRSETEILVELALQEIQKNYKNKKCRVADIGTGSGVIGLTLLMESLSPIELIASDLSEKALNLAHENYFNLSYAIAPMHKVQFVLSDRLNNIDGEFDLILSNPPYIKKVKDRLGVHQQVIKYEPPMALFLEDDFYDNWFEDFFQNIYLQLAPNGMSLLEGHEDHLGMLETMALKVGFRKTEVINDFTGRKRFLRLRKD